jgi:uncharacterized protein YbjT (DUF2867 family)
MKIVVTGSLGRISKPLTEILVKQGHDVTVISSQEERSAGITALGAKPAIGTVQDPAFLEKTFAGADVVYTMIPPGDYREPGLDVYAKVGEVVRNFKQALANTGVKRAVHLSSIGAHVEKGLGLLGMHYLAESILKELPIQVTFMRPTGFYQNLFGYLGMIKSQGFIAANYGEDDLAVWVASTDIAAAIAEEINKPLGVIPASSIRYVASDEVSCSDTARILGEAIGKPDLKWIRITDQQMHDGMIEAGMPEAIAAGMTEMYAASSRSKLYEDYMAHRPVLGAVKVKDFAQQFAAAYKAQ